jgi:soluble P-type ATPase
MEKGEKMIRLDIPLRGTLELHHAVFDMNGTLAIDGLPVPGVITALQSLAEHLALHALSAGTHGNMAELERLLNLPIHLVQSAEEKVRYVQQLDPTHVVAIGNGINDVGMLRLANIGIAILGSEGTAAQVLQAADVVALSPVDAIDLLLKPKRLVATLRG